MADPYFRTLGRQSKADVAREARQLEATLQAQAANARLDGQEGRREGRQTRKSTKAERKAAANRAERRGLSEQRVAEKLERVSPTRAGAAQPTPVVEAVAEPTTRAGKIAAKAKVAGGKGLGVIKAAPGKVKGVGKSLLKGGLYLAPAMAAANAALDPKAFIDKATNNGLISDEQNGWQNARGGAGQFFADTGNALSFGLAGRLGEGIASSIGGQGFASGWDQSAPAAQAATQDPATANSQNLLDGSTTGVDGTPLASPEQMAIPSTQQVSNGDGSGGFVTPVGPGASNPYGRTPELQQKIDSNVAGINAVTAQQAANHEAKLAMMDGRNVRSSTNGMSPEQAQIMKLAKSMRSGSIGDKNRNNVIQQKINALQGVDTNNVTRSGNASTASSAAAKLLYDQQQTTEDKLLKSNQRMTDLASDPATAGLAANELAGISAGQMLDPGQRSNLKLMGTNAMNDQSLWDSASTLFGPSNRLDQTNPSFVGAKAINGGGLIGDMVGAGPGWQFNNGSKLRRDGLSQATQDMYDQAIRQDNPR